MLTFYVWNLKTTSIIFSSSTILVAENLKRVVLCCCSLLATRWARLLFILSCWLWYVSSNPTGMCVRAKEYLSTKSSEMEGYWDWREIFSNAVSYNAGFLCFIQTNILMKINTLEVYRFSCISLIRCQPDEGKVKWFNKLSSKTSSLNIKTWVCTFLVEHTPHYYCFVFKMWPQWDWDKISRKIY